MTHLSDEVRHDRFRKLLTLYMRRNKGILSEDQIAQELGFFDGIGSPSARIMYDSLQEDWRLPDWVVYPDGVGERLDEGKQHRPTTPQGARKRKTQQNSAEVIEELPLPANAHELFDTGIERLQRYLNNLPMLVQQRQGKRFVTSLWIEGDVEDMHDRREYSEAKWKEICEARGLDPETAPEQIVDMVPPPTSCP